MTDRPITDSAKLLDAAQAAAKLGVSIRTLDRYQTAGLIKPIRAIHNRGAARKFHPEDVKQLTYRQDK